MTKRRNRTVLQGCLLQITIIRYISVKKCARLSSSLACVKFFTPVLRCPDSLESYPYVLPSEILGATLCSTLPCRSMVQPPEALNYRRAKKLLLTCPLVITSTMVPHCSDSQSSKPVYSHRSPGGSKAIFLCEHKKDL